MLQVEIRLKGQIDKHWSEWFEGMTVSHTEDGETVLSGKIPDETAMHGLLVKIRDLGLRLLSVTTQEHNE